MSRCHGPALQRLIERARRDSNSRPSVPWTVPRGSTPGDVRQPFPANGNSLEGRSRNAVRGYRVRISGVWAWIGRRGWRLDERPTPSRIAVSPEWTLEGNPRIADDLGDRGLAAARGANPEGV